MHLPQVALEPVGGGEPLLFGGAQLANVFPLREKKFHFVLRLNQRSEPNLVVSQMRLFVHPEAEKVRKFPAAGAARVNQLLVGCVHGGHVAPERRRVELHLADLEVKPGSSM